MFVEEECKEKRKDNKKEKIRRFYHEKEEKEGTKSAWVSRILVFSL